MSMASPQPPLKLDELRRLKWLLGGLLALVSLWTVFFLDVEALSLVLIASVLTTAALVWPQIPARVPVFVWRLSVPTIVALVVADFYLGNEVLPVLIRLAVLLVLYRAVSYRRKREDLQLIVLGLFLIVVAGVLTVSIGFALLLLVFTACALGFLFVITLIDMVDTGPRVMRPEEMRTVPSWARPGWGRFFPRFRQAANWRLILFSSTLFAVVVAFSAVLFLLIPRFELASGFFLDKYITRKAHTGFNDTVRFGDVGELVRDESVAMRVDLTDAQSVHEIPYWRLVPLDEYTPQGFRLSAGLKAELQHSSAHPQQFVRSGVRPSRPVGGVWTFYVEPGVSRFLPTPGRFVALFLHEQLPVQTSLPQWLFALRSEPMTMSAFQLEGVELDATLPDKDFARLLKGRRHISDSLREEKDYDERITLLGPQGPANEAALARIVAEITGGARLSPAKFAGEATGWLRNHHAYALSSHIPRGEADDIVKWLDSREPGFCEYFAAGLAVLCRSAGYPSRVIAGFHGGTLNAFENYYMVKNSDAHAWVEIFDGEGRWFRVDPTPGTAFGETTESAQAGSLASDGSWSARFDSLRMLWYRRIVNFDSRQQVKMLEDVKNFTTDSGNNLRMRLVALLAAAKAWAAAPWNAVRTGTTGATVTGLVLVLWLGVRLIRWNRARRPSRGRFDPVRREAGRWLGQLRQRSAGGARRPDEEELLDELQRVRFGRRETWPEPRAVFRRARRWKKKA
jgi:protein-glutamine gamma-glutamyltransferase